MVVADLQPHQHFAGRRAVIRGVEQSIISVRLISQHVFQHRHGRRRA